MRASTRMIKRVMRIISLNVTNLTSRRTCVADADVSRRGCTHQLGARAGARPGLPTPPCRARSACPDCVSLRDAPGELGRGLPYDKPDSAEVLGAPHTNRRSRPRTGRRERAASGRGDTRATPPAPRQTDARLDRCVSTETAHTGAEHRAKQRGRTSRNAARQRHGRTEEDKDHRRPAGAQWGRTPYTHTRRRGWLGSGRKYG